MASTTNPTQFPSADLAGIRNSLDTLRAAMESVAATGDDGGAMNGTEDVLMEQVVRPTDMKSLTGHDENLGTFFDQTTEWLAQEIAMVDMQLMREEDPEEIHKMQESRGELVEMQRQVDELFDAMMSIRRSRSTPGGAQCIKAQILVHGAALLAIIKYAVDKNRKNVIDARASDLAPVEKAIERKAFQFGTIGQAIDELEGASYDAADGLMDFLMMAGVAAAAGVISPEMVFDELMGSTLSDMASLPLSATAKQAAAEATAKERTGVIVNAVEDVRAGRQTLANIYDTLFHSKVDKVITQAPSVLNTRHLDKVMEFKTLSDNLSRDLHNPNSDHKAALEHTSRHLEHAMAEIHDGIGIVRTDLKQQQDMLTIAKSDIDRSLNGEPLRKDALHSVMGKEEGKKVAGVVELVKAKFKSPPSAETIEKAMQALEVFTQLYNIATHHRAAASHALPSHGGGHG